MKGMKLCYKLDLANIVDELSHSI